MRRALLLAMLLLAACASPAAPSPTSPAPQPTSPPATPTAAPPTLAPPTATATEPAATATATTAPASPMPTAPDVGGPADNPIARLPAGQALMLGEVHMLDASHGWAISRGEEGADAHVLRTLDGGLTWQDVSPPEAAGVPDEGGKQALGFFLDASRAWVTYFSGAYAPVPPRVWSTLDGGQTWTGSAMLEVTDAEFYGPSHMLFIDARTGWLLSHVGAGMSHDYVMVYRTDDGGQTWPKIVDPFADTLNMSCSKTGLAVAPDGQNAWISGDCYGVMPGEPYFQVTADGGQTWQQLDLPAPSGQPDLFKLDTMACGTYVPDISTWPAGHLVMQCRDYTKDPAVDQIFFYLTLDGGRTWQTTAFEGPLAAAAFSGQAGWLQLGMQAPYKVWRTADGGRTFTAGRDLNWKGQFSFVSAQSGWAVAQADDGALALVRTLDGGQKWQEIKPAVAP